MSLLDGNAPHANSWDKHFVTSVVGSNLLGYEQTSERLEQAELMPMTSTNKWGVAGRRQLSLMLRPGSADRKGKEGGLFPGRIHKASVSSRNLAAYFFSLPSFFSSSWLCS